MQNSRIPILIYHSIGSVIKSWNRNFLTMSPEYFEKQLKYVKRNYSVIGLNDYYHIKNGNMPSPKNPMVITIDDGFLDNWIWAFPLLRKYELKATIFVSPEMVDPTNIVRPNLKDLWKGRVNKQDLCINGYMSWEELRIMENSGYIDIQSHSCSHTKYFVSDKLIDFHHPGADCLYPVGNIFPERKPFHIMDNGFENLIPFGTPFFEERSSVIAKKVTINPEFNQACVDALKGYDFSNYKFNEALSKVRPVYDRFMKDNSVILKTETEDEHKIRLKYEITDSKKIIESKLNKRVEFLCWPHGDNDPEAHATAIQSGYKATTIGNLNGDPDALDRIGLRFGFKPFLKSETLGILKTQAKINEMKGSLSGKIMKKIYKIFK